ncbi:d12c667d-ffa0-4ba7-ac19-746dd072bc88 [Sclerotinia trifoliorum]|uniref:D12c667d-ffa0-4ba7-ac19-746dd072bc88 n=1 Tax=Sclerotinia trifoliorum TaxID=28548 RepID=A0A8H2VVR6_9HELO|nr:d12c667d-ffa0-4ba7-ac19-746dd072bc88 [Sclerotinia trifoliorum]
MEKQHPSGAKRKAVDAFASLPVVQKLRTTSASLEDPWAVLSSGDSIFMTDDGGKSFWLDDKINHPRQAVEFPRAVRGLDLIHKPSPSSYLQMIMGPRVKVFVGPKKKLFDLPKDLLSHYSPVLDRCFNGRLIESQTQTAYLPEDSVDDFEVLVEHILRHDISYTLSISNCGTKTAERCISFLKFADKYNLGNISNAVYHVLRPALIKYGKDHFKASYIEEVFGLTKSGDCLRELMADAAISFGGIELSRAFGKPGLFHKQEIETVGFASVLFQQLIETTRTLKIMDPFSNESKYL